MTRKEAVRILFDVPPAILDPAAIRAAFSRRMKAVHPDLNPSSPPACAVDVSRIIEARNLLRLCNGGLLLRKSAASFRATGGPGTGGTAGNGSTRGPGGPGGSGAAAGSAAAQAERPVFRAADSGVRFIPRRKLRFGLYVYYRGMIEWRQLIQAILEQRSRRPPFGRIAVEFEFFDTRELALLRGRLRPGRFIGETAVEMGLLSEDECEAVLDYQRRYSLRLGHILVQKQFLSMHELIGLLREFYSHNSRYPV